MQRMNKAGTVKVLWEYEDELEKDITKGMFNASKVDIVRMYPYVLVKGKKYYIEES